MRATHILEVECEWLYVPVAAKSKSFSVQIDLVIPAATRIGHYQLMRHQESVSEKVFAGFCSNKYLSGFVYQNPKFIEGSESEAGMV